MDNRLGVYDYVDLFRQADGSTGFLVGNVSGRGVGPALVMAMAKSLVFLQAQKGWDPGRSMAGLHEDLLALTRQRNYLGLCLGILGPEGRGGTLHLAGNPFPLLLKADSGSAAFVGTPSFPLASRKAIAPVRLDFSLDPGDLLLLYSTGIVNTRDAQGHPFGYERLQRCLQACRGRSADETLSRVCEELAAHAAGKLDPEDLTLLAVRRLPSQGGAAW